MLFIRRWAYRPPQPPVARGLVQAPCVPPQKGGPVKLRFRGPPFTPQGKSRIFLVHCFGDDVDNSIVCSDLFLPFLPFLPFPFQGGPGDTESLRSEAGGYDSTEAGFYFLPVWGPQGPNRPLGRGLAGGPAAPSLGDRGSPDQKHPRPWAHLSKNTVNTLYIETHSTQQP